MSDLKHYLLLAAILSVGFGLFLIFSFNRQVQIWITISLGASYVFWGMLHHLIKKDFHWRIVWEYLIVAIMAIVVVTYLLVRA